MKIQSLSPFFMAVVVFEAFTNRSCLHYRLIVRQHAAHIVSSDVGPHLPTECIVQSIVLYCIALYKACTAFHRCYVTCNSLTWHIKYIKYNTRPNVKQRGAGQRSGNSDSLRPGRYRNRIPVRARFSAPVQTGPGADPASCTMSTGSFPEVKRSGNGVTTHPI
jgi:hypothetical protein